uniref:Uncharacterized protein n=1 Tax=Alexandrium monilatum TaxID=311494 RepID=A0A7S4Q3K2_9DINO
MRAWLVRGLLARFALETRGCYASLRNRLLEAVRGRPASGAPACYAALDLDRVVDPLDDRFYDALRRALSPGLAAQWEALAFTGSCYYDWSALRCAPGDELPPARHDGVRAPRAAQLPGGPRGQGQGHEGRLCGLPQLLHAAREPERGRAVGLGTRAQDE